MAALLALPFLSSCFPAPVAPMPSLSYPAQPAVRQPNLLVLLEGIGSANTYFEETGIIAEIRARRLPFDVVVPHAHYGYYKAQTIEVRLREDVLEPARRQGYRKIWLAGFSMGGAGAILYARDHPSDIDGVLLICPFLGGTAIHREIQAAGGVAAWNRTTTDPQDWERFLWTWIKTRDPAATPPIWLGYGADDTRVGDGPPLLAATLPAARVFKVPGGHTLATFKAVFQHDLDTLAQEQPQGSVAEALTSSRSAAALRPPGPGTPGSRAGR